MHSAISTTPSRGTVVRNDSIVRVSLLALRGYLVLMTLLVLYHVLDLAGIFAET